MTATTASESEIANKSQLLDGVLAMTKKQQEAAMYVENLYPQIQTFDIKKFMKDKRNFLLAMFSKRRTGKSVLMRDLVHQIKDWYEEVYVFSMTALDQPDMFDFVKPENIIHGYDEEKLLQIWTIQETKTRAYKKLHNVKTEKCPHILVIFDDIVSDPKIRHSKIFDSLAVCGRHKAIGFN